MEWLGVQQWQRKSRPEKAITSGKRNTQQDFRANLRAGGHKPKSQDFHQTAENERRDNVEVSVPSETKEDTAYRERAGAIEALIILGNFARPDPKRMMVITLGLTGTL
jgi:hypothetical protein